MPAPQSQSTPFSGGIGQIVGDVLQKNATKTGVVGGAVYVGAQLGLGIIHRSWDTILQAVGYSGLLIALGGIAFRTKKTTDIIVASEAEKRLDPMTPHSPISTVPAIQREIEKQETARRSSDGVPRP
jgi:hypothetical protein